MLVQIHDLKGDDPGILAVDLRDLLPLLKATGHGLNWVLADFDGVLSEGSSPFSQQVLHTALLEKSSLPLSWAQLEVFASEVFQTWDALLVGVTPGTALPLPSDPEFRRACEIIVENVDTSFWEITTSDPVLVKKIQNTFRDVRIVK